MAVPLLRLRQKLLGPGFVQSYVGAAMLTHDPEQARQYSADPLVFRQIAVNILLDLIDTEMRLVADAGAITVPTLMLATDSDWVVRVREQRQFFDRLSSPIKRWEVLPGFYHSIFHEKGRAVVIDKVRAFVVDRFAGPPAVVSLLDADKRGYTKAEYDCLRKPGGFRFTLTRWAMQTVGRLSEGIRLGWRAGFDSGRTLDYVYENRPRGLTPVGRWIDRSYLNSIGWRGIRQRRIHLGQLLRQTIEQTHAAGAPIRLLDIASGPGRYLLETIHQLRHLPITALLRDYQQENLAAARRLAEELGLQGVTIAHGDAFDRAALAAIRPRPNHRRGIGAL
jgi:hypothetical protein